MCLLNSDFMTYPRDKKKREGRIPEKDQVQPDTKMPAENKEGNQSKEKLENKSDDQYHSDYDPDEESINPNKP